MNLLEIIRDLVASCSAMGLAHHQRPDAPARIAVDMAFVDLLRQFCTQVDNYYESEDEIVAPLYTVAYGNFSDGVVLEGVYTSPEEAARAADGDEWHIVPIYPETAPPGAF